MKIKYAASLGIILTAGSIVFAAPAQRQPAASTESGPKSAAMTRDQAAYLGRLRAKLMNSWYIPDGKNSVIISTTVNSDGSVDSVEISSNPKSEQAEQSASDAFSKAQPLEVLPPWLKSAKLTVTFVSSADPHGDSSSNVLTRLDPIKQPPAQGKPEEHQ